MNRLSSPLQLSILIHYYGCADDFRFGDFSAIAVKDAIEWFKQIGMLEDKEPGTYEYPIAALRLTDRGRFFVEALCSMPYPESYWCIPKEAA